MAALAGNRTYKKFHQIVQKKPIHELSDGNLSALFELLKPAPEFECIFLTLENVVEIYNHVPNIANQPPWKTAGDKILATRRAGESFLKNEKTFTAEISGLKFNLDSKGKNIRSSSLDRAIKNNPEALFCAAMGYLPVQKTALDKFHILLAEVWLCKTALIAHPSEETISVSLSPALETIRTLSRVKQSVEIRELPSTPLTPEKYLGQLKDIPENYELKKVTDFISDVVDLLNNTPLDFDGKTDESEPEDPLGTILIETPLPIPRGPTINVDIIEPITPTIPAKRSNKNTLRIGSAQIRKKLSLENQHFPFSYRTLSKSARLELINYLINGQSDVLTTEEIETAALLSLTFWGGLDNERLSNLKIEKERIHNSESDCLFLREGTLRLKSKYPDIKYTPSERASKQLHQRQFHIDINLPDQALLIIMRHVENGRNQDGRLFNRTPAEINSDLKRCIADIQRDSGTHITMKTVQTYLPYRLGRSGMGDPSTMDLTFGIKSYLGRTKVHYAAFDEFDLALSYKQLCHTILKEAEIDVKATYEYPCGTTSHVGTPRRPVRHVIRETIERLINIIHPEVPQKNIDEFIQRHNAYVTLTALTIAYSTGFRAVRHPYIDSQSYDPITGFCGIDDKDSIKGNCARPVWLPATCIKHLDYFRQYLDRLVITDKSKNLPHKEIENNKLASLFFLKKTSRGIKASLLTPKTLEVELKKVRYFIPLNSQRHFLKGELQEAGCPPDVIELYLGHWEIGEEGFSPSSALHPADYKLFIDENLAPLLDTIGLKTIHGPSIPTSDFQISIDQIPRDSSARQERKGHRKEKLSEGDHQKLQQALKGIVSDKILSASNENHWLVLHKIFKSLPGLLQPDERKTIAPETIEKFYYKLGKRRSDQRTGYKQQTIFLRLLKSLAGNEIQKVDLPPPPIILPAEKNLIRATIGKHLGLFRIIEKAFIEDIEKTFVKDTNALIAQVDEETLSDILLFRAGQIYLSAVLYGGLLSRTWALTLPQSLESGLFQIGDILWTDLWSGKGRPKEELDRFLAQMEPSRYRRWLPDPTTQLLLYRWMKDDPTGYKCCGKMPLEGTLAKYLDHLKIKCLPGQSTLNSLLKIAGAFASTSLPPFIVAYAKGILPSASLPDERWHRAISGQNVALPKAIKERKIRPFKEKNFLLSTQQKLRKQLCQIIFPDNGDQNLPNSTIIKNIECFQEENENKACPIIQLLVGWGIFLLQDRRYEETPHKLKTALKQSSVQTYITQIGNILIKSIRWRNPTIMDVKELQEVFTEIGTELKKTSKTNPDKAEDNEYDNASINTIRTLNLFHWYLEVCYNVSYDCIAALIKSANEPSRVRVSAQIILPNEFKELLRTFNFEKISQSRIDAIACCILILAYRFGLRRREILGLRIKDIVILCDFELSVVSHRGRGTKSSSAKRNLPDYLPVPEEELNFLKKWIEKRTKERKAKPGSYLFTASEFETRMFADNELTLTIIDRIKKVTDDRSVLHHGRHSFYNNLLLQSTLRSDIPIITYPAVISQAEKLSSKYLEAVMGNGKTGRQKLHAIAMLSGHADVATGFFSYFHLCDWLLNYHTKHTFAAPRLTTKAARALLCVSQPQANNILRNQGFPFAESVHRAASKIKLQHPCHSKAIYLPKRRTNPNKKNTQSNPLPRFETALEQVMQDVKSRKHLPKNTEDLMNLEAHYNRIRNLHGGTRHKLIRIAKNLTPKIKKGFLECSVYQQARDLLWFEENSEIPMGDKQAIFIRGRKKKGDQKSFNNEFIRWHQKLPKLSFQASGKRTKSKKGFLRIPLPKDLIAIFHLIQ